MKLARTPYRPFLASLLVLVAASLCEVSTVQAFVPSLASFAVRSVCNEPTVVTQRYAGFSDLFDRIQPYRKADSDRTPVPAAIQGVGDRGCELPSPSRINTLPKPAQAKVFVGYFAAIGLGTYYISAFLVELVANNEWAKTWSLSFPLLGLVFAAAGVAHFTLQQEFENIMPRKGAWGIWYLPGEPAFHVQWTGVAEILGGTGMVVGGILNAFFPTVDSPHLLSSAGLLSDSAACLFLLTLAVTPANIYSYTHGARLPMEGPEIPVPVHIGRAVFQAVLLALFLQMGQETFSEWITQLPIASG